VGVRNKRVVSVITKTPVKISSVLLFIEFYEISVKQ
jgi:hypothetical protein